VKTSEQKAQYVAGLFDGEGSFVAYWQKNARRGKTGTARITTNTSLACAISIQMRLDDAALVELAMKHIGAIYSASGARARTNNRAPTRICCVKRIAELHNKVIPFFREFGLLGKKRIDFEIWSQIVELGYHKTQRWEPEARKMAEILVDLLQGSREFGSMERTFEEFNKLKLIKHEKCTNGQGRPIITSLGEGKRYGK
jgi:hypothetical protein